MVKASRISPRGAPESIRVAVLGTGNIGLRHLRILQGMELGQPVAVPARPERVDQLKAEGFCAAASLEQAARAGASLCIIATETGSHVAGGLEAIESGLDLLVEKPLSTNADEARRLLEAAARAKRRVFVGCVLRYSKSLAAFRRWLSQIGRLHSVTIECRSYLPDWRPHRPYLQSYSARPHEGGVLLDLIHEIDYAGWMFGWPSSLQATLRNLGTLGIAAEEMAELNWETEAGCSVSVHLDYLTRPPSRRLRACGELGTIEWDGVAGAVTLALAGAPAEQLRPSQGRDELFLAQTRAFLRSSGGRRDPNLATGEDGVRALAVCDAARRSSLSRAEEKVNYP